MAKRRGKSYLKLANLLSGASVRIFWEYEVFSEISIQFPFLLKSEFSAICVRIRISPVSILYWIHFFRYLLLSRWNGWQQSWKLSGQSFYENITFFCESNFIYMSMSEATFGHRRLAGSEYKQWKFSGWRITVIDWGDVTPRSPPVVTEQSHTIWAFHGCVNLGVPSSGFCPQKAVCKLLRIF
jgi:hypothetical protein